MKNLIAAIAVLILSAGAYATDYGRGQCPIEQTCAFGSSPSFSPTVFGPVTYSDTSTFFLGNWTNTYSNTIYEYTSSNYVLVDGGKECVVTSGRVPHAICGSVTIDSASIDGMSLTPPVNGSTSWTLPISLSPGPHTAAVTWSAPIGYYFLHWTGQVNGIVYTQVPLPPTCADCGD